MKPPFFRPQLLLWANLVTWPIITARKRSVCLSTGGGGLGPERGPRTVTSGQYASYWNDSCICNSFEQQFVAIYYVLTDYERKPYYSSTILNVPLLITFVINCELHVRGNSISVDFHWFWFGLPGKVSRVQSFWWNQERGYQETGNTFIQEIRNGEGSFTVKEMRRFSLSVSMCIINRSRATGNAPS